MTWLVLVVTLLTGASDPPAEVIRPDPAIRVTRYAVLVTVWDRLADCESDGNWHIDTGNGYAGGLQWHPETYAKVRPAGAPADPAAASREQEIAAAEALMATGWGGFHHWPACSRALGLR